jgi:hypothetical protein
MNRVYVGRLLCVLINAEAIEVSMQKQFIILELNRHD